MSITRRPRKVGSAGAEYLYAFRDPASLPSEQIQVDCSLEEANWLEANIDCVEEHPTDADRVRFRYKDGRTSPWFSRLWQLNIAHVGPISD